MYYIPIHLKQSNITATIFSILSFLSILMWVVGVENFLLRH